MKGPEIVAVLNGILNTTTLNAITSEDKVEIRRMLNIIDLCLFSAQYQVNA